jgi:hypothetical protein
MRVYCSSNWLIIWYKSNIFLNNVIPFGVNHVLPYMCLCCNVYICCHICIKFSCMYMCCHVGICVVVCVCVCVSVFLYMYLLSCMYLCCRVCICIVKYVSVLSCVYLYCHVCICVVMYISVLSCMYLCCCVCTRWFKYDWDKLWLVYTQIVPVIFEPLCICAFPLR